MITIQAPSASDSARSLYASGNYYNTLSPETSNTSITTGNGVMRVAPWLLPSSLRIVRIGVETTVAGSAGAQMRPVIYADDGTGYPGALLLDGGALDATVVGFLEATVDITLRGLVWIGAVQQGAAATQPTVRTGFERPTIPMRIGTAMALQNAYGFAQSGVTGTPPATFSTTISASSQMPRLFVKVG